MKFTRAYFAVLSLVVFVVCQAPAQDSDTSGPTVKQPVVINLTPVDKQLAPGQRSAFVVTFKLPKFIWLGAKPGEDRTPPGTRVIVQDLKGFSFENPRYPEPEVEGVPVHLGLTRVFMGEVDIVVPFQVDESVEPGNYEIQTLLTYTPGFNAGKLSTHTNEPYSVSVSVSEDAQPTDSEIPEPSTTEVSEDFQIPEKRKNFPDFLWPMFVKYPSGTGFSKSMHKIFLDKSGHNKNLSHVTYPYITSTRQEGQSYGLGLAILNSTKEGVMTGTMSILGYHNQRVGPTGGFDLITCPAAYHNTQLSVRISGEDYLKFDWQYENFLFGENDRWGIDSRVTLQTDPRHRYYGVGAETDEEDITIYDREEFGGVADFYHFPVNKLRIGVGFKARDVEVKEGLDDIDVDQLDNDAPLTVDEGQFSGDQDRLSNSTILGGRLNVIWDGRNQEFNSSKGFFAKVTAEYNTITDAENDAFADVEDELETEYAQIDVDMSKYFSSVGQKFNFLIRNKWSFSTSKDIPFYELSTLGGPKDLRAFDLGRFRGQHMVFASMEMRYIVMNVTIMGFPMALQMGGFLDVGQVFESDDVFTDDVNINPGGSIRFVNYPNVGYVLNVAHGDDGVNVTGGISLPF